MHQNSMKRVLIIQNESVEDPGEIIEWSKQNNVELVNFKAFEGELPNVDQLSECVGIAVLGGFTDVVEREDHPWLKNEIEMVKEVIQNGTIPILGICLGAQILAHCFGADVIRMEEKESGILPIELLNLDQIPPNLASIFGKLTEVTLDHSYQFQVPDSAVLVGSTTKCPHQIMFHEPHYIGLQMHLEWTEKHVMEVCENFVKQEGDEEKFAKQKEILFELLNTFFEI